MLAAVGWYYAGVLRDDALRPAHDPDTLDLIIESVEDDRIVLRATDEASENGDWQRDGRYGLQWDGGWAYVGAITARDRDTVTRELELIDFSPPEGTSARLDGQTFPVDPFISHGITFEEVMVAGELGEMPAWLIPGGRDTWAIFIHGKGATRREGLRIVPSLHASGLPVLVITYRNDELAPASDDGYYRYGETEWQDLEAAVRFAAERGAKGVVLVGYSMGGGIALAFLDRSPLAHRVIALIADAPLLSFEATVDFKASKRRLPGVLTWVGKRFGSWRFDIDWSAADHRGTARRVAVPVLLFHGDDDGTNPVAESDSWAEDRPTAVTYVRVSGAAHVRAWNLDPDAYAAAVRSFIEKVVPR